MLSLSKRAHYKRMLTINLKGSKGIQGHIDHRICGASSSNNVFVCNTHKASDLTFRTPSENKHTLAN
jgi:hypothetical protein